MSTKVIGNIDGNKNISTKQTVFVFMIVFATLCWGLIPPLFDFIDISAQWNELKTKSGAHNVMTTAYRECRNKLFEEASPSECQLFALNYGKARGFENAQAVFDDIVTLSNQLAAEHSYNR